MGAVTHPQGAAEGDPEHPESGHRAGRGARHGAGRTLHPGVCAVLCASRETGHRLQQTVAAQRPRGKISVRSGHYLISLTISSSHLISSHLISSHLISSPHLTSPHLTSPHLTSPHLITSFISGFLIWWVTPLGRSR